MDIAVLIMTTDSEPSITNIEGMQETFIKRTQEGQLQHKYDFILYTGDTRKNGLKNCNYSLISNRFQRTYVDLINDRISDFKELDCHHRNGNIYKFASSVDESIYRTFEKTYDVLDYLSTQEKEYDFYIRINISAWLNINLLDKIIEQLDKDIVYCNAINSIISDEKYLNDLYPRGDFIIFSSKVKDGILENGKKYLYCDTLEKDRLNVPHVDDCLIGLCLIDYFGKYYYKHLKMLKYNYIPYNQQEPKQIKILEYAICSRVKTLPPNVSYSGYSWEDNKYRRYDSVKMRMLDDAYSNMKYDNVLLKDLEVNESEGRPTLMTYMINTTVDKFYKYLDKKRES